jgi:hypothetical protein
MPVGTLQLSFRREGRCRKSVAIEQIALRAVCPSIPNEYGDGHVRARRNYGGTVDRCRRGHVYPVPSGNFETCHRPALRAQAFRVIEPGSDRAGFSGGLTEHGAGILDVFAIGQDARNTGETQANVEFVGWVDVVGVLRMARVRTCCSRSSAQSSRGVDLKLEICT